MVEGAEHWGHNEQGEDDNCTQVRKQDGRVASTFERTIRHPDCQKTVRCGESIADGRVFVLSTVSLPCRGETVYKIK